MAQTINDKEGSSCEQVELAARMGQTATGGTFRTANAPISPSPASIFKMIYKDDPTK
jgi:hypothetical protein